MTGYSTCDDQEGRQTCSTHVHLTTVCFSKMYFFSFGGCISSETTLYPGCG